MVCIPSQLTSSLLEGGQVVIKIPDSQEMSDPLLPEALRRLMALRHFTGDMIKGIEQGNVCYPQGATGGLLSELKIYEPSEFF